jgi:TrmH family RNA methyltransferase
LKLLSLARDLKRRKSREKNGLFVAEGVRAVEELIRSPLELQGALTAPQLADAPRGAALSEALRQRGVRVEDVSPAEFASAAETDSPQGVLGIARIPERSFDDLSANWKGIILVLDAVQDPGNVGTIVRSAAALGVVATVTLPGTVDLWNAKVVRSGMGAHFIHPSFSTTWPELDAFRTRHNVALYGADASGEEINGIPRPNRLALIVGNEGAGVSPETKSRVDRLVGLKLAAGVESLNVAVATGILLHALSQ